MAAKKMSIQHNTNINKSRIPLPVIMVDGQKKIMTRTVRPAWYARYAHVLSEDERMYEQPNWDRKRDHITWAKEFKRVVVQTEDDEALARKALYERNTRVECAVAIMQGRQREAKAKLNRLKTRRFSFSPSITDLHSMSTSITALDLIDRRNFRLPSNSKWRLLKDNKVIKLKLAAMAKAIKTARIIRRWQKAISTVRAVLRFWNIVTEIAATTSSIFAEFEKIINAGAKDDNIEKMMFDRTKYNRPLQSSHELDQESILTLRDQEDVRSEEAVLHAAKNLRCLKSFAEYPLSHQMIMARIGQYIEIPADKVIIREGQPPHNFYFLLSGRAVAVKMSGSLIHGEGGEFQVVKGFEQGAIFGDDGLYDCDFRAYSVSSVTSCQIISINIDDHIRLTSQKMPGHGSADHMRFICQLEMMKKFPLGRLVDETEHRHIIFFYFHPGRVITRKNDKSEYVFIVKTGSCKVLAEIGDCVGDTKTPKGFRKESFPDLSRKSSCVKSVVVSSQMSELNMHFKRDSESPIKNVLIPTDINENPTKIPSQTQNVRWSNTSNNSSVKSPSSKTCDKKCNPCGESDLKRKKRSCINQLPGITTNNYVNQKNANISDNAIPSLRKATMAQGQLLRLYKESSPKTTKGSNRASRKATIESGEIQEGQVKTQMWVFMHDLKQSDSFGIEDFDLGDEVRQTCDLAVVSSGCEMILISKKFLLKHMSEQMKEHWRQLGKQHPSEEAILNRLKLDEHWRSFRQKAHADMNNIRNRPKHTR